MRLERARQSQQIDGTGIESGLLGVDDLRDKTRCGLAIYARGYARSHATHRRVVELRPWTTNDASFLLDACCDAQIRRFWLRQPLETLDDAIEMIEGFAASWAEYQKSGTMKRLAFLITDRVSGAPLGLCGVDEWFADGSVQIGYFLAAGVRGMGYTTRAVQLLTKWLLKLGAAKVFATTDPLNVPSIAVLRRAGFAHETRLRESRTHDAEEYDLAMYTYTMDSSR